MGISIQCVLSSDVNASCLPIPCACVPFDQARSYAAPEESRKARLSKLSTNPTLPGERNMQAYEEPEQRQDNERDNLQDFS